MMMMQQAAARTPEREAFCDRNGVFKMVSLLEQPHGSVTGWPTTRHGNFQRYLKTFGLITMVGVSANFTIIGQAQARGDFSVSCTNIQLKPWISLRPQC
jgi:hypothetical protein